MDIIRFIQIYIIQFGIGLFCLFLGLLILKRDRKRLNQIFSGSFVSIFIGVTINVIYANLYLNPIVSILHVATVFFLYLAQIFLLVFNLMILKSEKVIDTKKQIGIIAIFVILII